MKRPANNNFLLSRVFHEYQQHNFLYPEYQHDVEFLCQKEK